MDSRQSAVCVASALIAIASLLVVSCNKSQGDGRVGQTGAALIAPESTAGFGATAANQPMQEPSGAFATPRSLVVGFNTTTRGGQGWAVSNDFGVTFDRQCDFNGFNFSGGLPCTPVPIPINSKIPIGSDGGEVWSWGGNSLVVADGLGNVADVIIGGQGFGQDGTAFVAVAISQNGGASFDSTTIVNDTGCGNGVQDQPNAVFDYTTSPPTLWIVWRHTEVGGDGTVIPGTAGACIRRGVIVKTIADGGPSIASVRWLDDPQVVHGLAGFYQYGVAIAAGDGVVTVMYAAGTTFLPGNGPGNTHPKELCPDNGGLFSVDFGTADSFDNGHNWVDNAKIFHSPSFQWCVIGGPPGVPGQGTVLTNLRPFGLARAPGGIEYAIVQDSRNTARLFMSAAAGIKGWQNPLSTVRTWNEWCPGTPTSTVDGGPTSNWKSTGISNTDATPCSVPAIATDPTNIGLDLAMPTIASDGRGNIAMGDMEQITNDPASGATVNYALRAVFNPQRAGAVLQGPSFISATPQAIMPNTGNFRPRPYGDYGGLAVRPSGSFAPFAQPGCLESNDFFPLFTGNDGSNNPDIIVRGFSLTPP